MFWQQVNELSLLLGGGEIKTVWNLITPLGISFYTFQTMGYVVDVYWEKCPAQRNFPKLLLFTSFFPQVTQGPISDYQQLSQQLFAQHDFKDENITFGFQRMLWGYFKKMVIADAAAPLVQTVFASYQLLPGNNVLIGAFLYSLQIYADFSGYMDIICGPVPDAGSSTVGELRAAVFFKICRRILAPVAYHPGRLVQNVHLLSRRRLRARPNG